MTKARRPESALRYSLLELNHLGNKWIYLVQTQGKYNLWIIILVASSSELNMCLVLNLHGRFILQLSLLILLLVVTTIGWHGASTLHHLLSLLPGLLPGRPRRSHDETLPLVQVRISLRRVAENHLIIPHAFLISPYSPLPFEYTLLKYMRRMHSPRPNEYGPVSCSAPERITKFLG